MQPCQLSFDATIKHGIAYPGDDSASQSGVYLDFDLHATACVRRQALLQTVDLFAGEFSGTTDFGDGNAGTLVEHSKCSIDDDPEQIRSATHCYHPQEVEHQGVNLAIEPLPALSISWRHLPEDC
jgi:hypothetical protein